MRWTKEEEEAIRWCKSMGWNAKEIAKAISRSYCAVRKKWQRILAEPNREKKFKAVDLARRGIIGQDLRFQRAFLLAYPTRRYESMPLGAKRVA